MAPEFVSPFSSPLLNDNDTFVDVRAAALITTVISGLSGHPLTAAYAQRLLTVTSLCKTAATSPLPFYTVPVEFQIGDSVRTRYFVGAIVTLTVGFTCLAIAMAMISVILAKSKGASWRSAFIVGRYPQNLLFVFLYVMHSVLSASVTVLMLDEDPGRQAGVSIVLTWWIGVTIALCFFLFRNVMFEAVYVRRYREVSDDQEMERDLHYRLQKLEEKNRKEEEEVFRMREEAERQARNKELRDERVADVGSMMSPEDQELDAIDPLTGEPENGSLRVGPDGTPMAAAGSKQPPSGGGRSGSPGSSPPAAAASPFSFRQELFRTLRSILPEDEQEELLRHSEQYVSASVRADEAERERLRRATNLVYSKMLASQILANSFEDFAVREAIRGRDRWEDRQLLPGEAATMDPILFEQMQKQDREEEALQSLEQQAAISSFVPAPIVEYLTGARRKRRSTKVRTGFISKWGGLFRFFKERTYWFMVVEFSVTIFTGLIEGWRPTDPGNSCYGPACSLMVVNVLYLFSLIAFRPYVVTLDAFVTMFVGLLQMLGATLMVVAVSRDSPSPAVAGYVFAVGGVYLLILKAMLDVFSLVAPLLYRQEVAWPMNKLTEHYFNTERKTSDALFYERRDELKLRDELNSIERGSRKRSSSQGSGSASASGSGVASGSGAASGGEGSGFDDAYSGASETRPHNGSSVASKVDSGGSPTKRTRELSSSPKRVPRLNVRVVDTLENEATRYRSIGGRRNAFVTSRGVPDAFHPFSMCPWPGRIRKRNSEIAAARRPLRAALGEGRSVVLGTATIRGVEDELPPLPGANSPMMGLHANDIEALLDEPSSQQQQHGKNKVVAPLILSGRRRSTALVDRTFEPQAGATPEVEQEELLDQLAAVERGKEASSLFQRRHEGRQRSVEFQESEEDLSHHPSLYSPPARAASSLSNQTTRDRSEPQSTGTMHAAAVASRAIEALRRANRKHQEEQQQQRQWHHGSAVHHNNTADETDEYWSGPRGPDGTVDRGWDRYPSVEL